MSRAETAPRLVKFLVTSAACLCLGTIHGVLQITEPIRSWLASIGTPLTNPGHLIDPLAHAHINIVGGLVIFMMGVMYYVLPRMSGKAIYSERLVEHTYWWTTLGVASFYSTLMTFGIWEGLLMHTDPVAQASLHRFYGPVVSVAATILAAGFAIFFYNVARTALGRREAKAWAAQASAERL